MQYGHCVVSATETAINCLCKTSMAPALNASLSKAQKAFIDSGAFSSSFFSRVRFFISNIGVTPLWLLGKALPVSRFQLRERRREARRARFRYSSHGLSPSFTRSVFQQDSLLAVIADQVKRH